LNIISEVSVILDQAGYKTKYADDNSDVLYFEDESLLGFVAVYPTIDELIANWKNHQDAFLIVNADKLRASVEKTWNAYSIYLTQDSGKEVSLKELLNIEENFSGTRKIARNDINTKDDIIQALLHILPIKKINIIQSQDFIKRLKDRVKLKQEILTALLEEDPKLIANMLMEESKEE
jgi:hypothetical protein